MNTDSLQAAIRFGFGRRGTERLPADPAAWLRAQLAAPDPGPPGPSLQAAMQAFRQDREDPVPAGERRRVGVIFNDEVSALTTAALESAMPFRERLVRFWANHFTVSTRGGMTYAFAGDYVRSAIRPNVTGRFSDMLLAVMRHPAMLAYLDNAGSVGPGSPYGRRSGRGLNENLARECLELHTVSPAAGYDQADVTSFAKIITGWSFARDAEEGGFRFRPNVHEPGAKTLMGHSFDPGEEGGVAALAFLANHPATHRHLATKLVRHFIADDPAPAAVKAVEAVLRDTGGDLGRAAAALVALPAAWQPLNKLRTPEDYVLAVLRAADLPADKRPDVPGILRGLGQAPFGAPFPIGWPDRAQDWTGPEPMMRRVDWSYGFTGRVAQMDPQGVAEASLGPLLHAGTADAIRRAGSRRDGMTLLFASPEFQRR